MAKRTFRTKKKLSGVKTEYRAWKEWDEGDVVIAKLVGTSVNRKNKSKNDWIVEVEEAMFSDSKAAKAITGKTLTLNTAGQLDKGMTQVEIGDLVQVTYNGQKEMQGGEYEGQMAHTMEVELVEEDNGEESEEDLDEEEESEEEESEEESEEEEAPPSKKKKKKSKKSDDDDL